MPLPAFRVFISSTTQDLKEYRAAAAGIFNAFRANVHVERDYPTDIDSLASIDNIIRNAQFLVCLIGHVYGQPLPPGHECSGHLSYTQHEYRMSLATYLEGLRGPDAWQGMPPKLFVFIFDGPDTTHQDPAQAELQRSFRAEVESELKELGLFFYRFQTLDQLHSLLANALSGPMLAFKRRRWERVKQEFQESVRKSWREEFPVEIAAPEHGPSERDWEEVERLGDRAPFLKDQAMERLVPDAQGGQLKYLSPDAFVVGRDTENEARASRNADWRLFGRKACVDELVGTSRPDEAPARLFFVSGGGVGKTTNLKWIASHIDSDDGGDTDVAASRPLAVFIDATSLGERGLLHAVVDRIRNETRMILNPDAQNAIGWQDKISEQDAIQQLEQDRKDGRLLLIVDGLDHLVGARNLIREEIQGVSSEWARCPIILSGRPHVLLDWTEREDERDARMLARNWRFCRVGELNEPQQRLYLRRTSSKPRTQRFDLVPMGARRTLQVPRVLSYVARLDDAELSTLKGAADAYFRALRKVIEETVRNGGAACKSIGLRPGRTPPTPSVHLEYVMALLGAMAFVMMKTVEEAYARDPRERTNIDNVDLGDAFKRALLERVSTVYSPCSPRDRGMDGLAELNGDLDGLIAFSAVVHNNVLERASPGKLFWDNRSVLAFFVAYWLSRHAAGAAPGETSLDDSATFKSWLFYPEDLDNGDRYYEVNAFLAEMPEAAIEPYTYSWASAAANWYEPEETWNDERKWSSEMLYRSWQTIHAIAGETVDDWWDVSYDVIYETAADAAVRGAKSPHVVQKDKSVLHREFALVPTAARERAGLALHRFRNDLNRQLRGAYGETQRRRARAFIDERNWRRVPEGRFRMGRSEGNQGFPPKTEAYWTGVAERLRRGGEENLPRTVAESCNPPRWFTGAQGTNYRRAEIRWLEKVFEKYAACPPEQETTSRKELMDTIQDRWRRLDQFSAEDPQEVAAFEMQSLPVLNAWFWLFAPGHGHTVRTHLRDYARDTVGPDLATAKTDEERQEQQHKKRIASAVDERIPPADHPVTYVNWFDCWAFCQWARWDAKGQSYQCRLPHEVEWEFAARHKRGSWWSRAKAVDQDMPYWWGSHFYQRETEGVPEHISRRVAHAMGFPGSTRAPRLAKANGLGFKDMLGNTWEWCANVYDVADDRAAHGKIYYSRKFPENPPPFNNNRTMRGGLWYFLDLLSYCSHRFRLTSDDRDYKMGFRVVREKQVRERSPANAKSSTDRQMEARRTSGH